MASRSSARPSSSAGSSRTRRASPRPTSSRSGPAQHGRRSAPTGPARGRINNFAAAQMATSFDYLYVGGDFTERAARSPRPTTSPDGDGMPFTDIAGTASRGHHLGLARGHHAGCSPTLYCPGRQGHPRRDGELPRPGPGLPATRPTSSATTTGRPTRATSTGSPRQESRPAVGRQVLPDRQRQPRRDGELPGPSPRPDRRRERLFH